MKRVLALSDSLSPWHSFWIRFGQYIPQPTHSCQQRPSPGQAAAETPAALSIPPNWWALLEQLPVLRRKGIRLISDVDDCLWQAPGWNRSRLIGVTNLLPSAI